MDRLSKRQLRLFFLILFLVLATTIVSIIYHFNEVRHQEYLDNVTSRYTKAYKSAYFEKKTIK